MSWLDGMIDDAEAASQDQRLERTTALPAPGLFAGSYDATGQGLVLGAVEGGNTAKSLYLNLALSGGPEQNMFGDTSTLSAPATQQINQQIQDIGKDTASAVSLLTPDPTTTGKAAEILGGAATILPRALIGGLVAGPAGAALSAGAPAGYAGTQTALAQGIDENTADLKGVIEGTTGGLGAVLPAARIVGPILGDAALSIGANVGLGMAGRGATGALLESHGYKAQAAQYKALDSTAIATDAVMGAAFFGLGRLTGGVKPTTDQIDAALTERTAQHFDVDTAPGTPVDPKSAAAHQEAMTTAVDQLSRGEPVNVPDSIHEATFLRPGEDFGPVTPSRDEALASARQDVEPQIRAELEQQAAGSLPNVRDVKAELASVQQSLDDLPDTFRDRAKAFQDEGMGRKKAEQAARQAIEQARADLSDRHSTLTNSLDGNRAAEQARADLNTLGRGDIPDRFQSRVEDRADAITKGFQKNPLAVGIAQGNTRISLAGEARKEIARHYDEIEQANPTPEPVHLDIGLPKDAASPVAEDFPTRVGRASERDASGAPVFRDGTAYPLSDVPRFFEQHVEHTEPKDGAAVPDVLFQIGHVDDATAQGLSDFLPGFHEGLREARISGRTIKHIQDSRPGIVKDVLDRLERGVLQADEVLPNHQNPRRALLVLRDVSELPSKARHQSTVIELAADGKGLDVVTAMTMPDRTLNKARALKEEIEASRSEGLRSPHPQLSTGKTDTLTRQQSNFPTVDRDASGASIADGGRPASTGGRAARESADPVDRVAGEILARVEDLHLPTGEIDADGNPVTVSARELMAQADADIATAHVESKGFMAAATCFLQRGNG